MSYLLGSNCKFGQHSVTGVRMSVTQPFSGTSLIDNSIVGKLPRYVVPIFFCDHGDVAVEKGVVRQLCQLRVADGHRAGAMSIVDSFASLTGRYIVSHLPIRRFVFCGEIDDALQSTYFDAITLKKKFRPEGKHVIEVHDGPSPVDVALGEQIVRMRSEDLNGLEERIEKGGWTVESFV
jgi:hypothetical protein